MRAKFGRGPTVVSKKGLLKFISRLCLPRMPSDRSSTVLKEEEDYTALHGGGGGVKFPEIWPLFKAKIYAISSDTHQLQFIKLHHFNQERF